ncbi:MAG: BACON domain-containing protein [Bacteroidales bacterium]|nr:BACON domain-containing protein [Bacteroidales bacterium]
MKTRSIFVSLLAVLSLGVACEKEADHYISEVKLDSSIVTIPVEGGSTTLAFTAADAWEFEKIFAVKTGEKDSDGNDIVEYQPLPTWLTASATSGVAGEAKVVLTAPSTLDGRNTELRISCAGATQIVKVVQGVSTVSPATCEEVIAGPDSKTYQVTGVCTKIVNTTYGNWYLADATGEIYIYGTLDAKGATKNFLSLGLEAGDVVTVEGPKTTYNGVVELVDVTVVKIVKSLVKIESGSEASFDAAGGEFTAKVVAKGDGPAISIPDDAQDWIGISNISIDGDTTFVSFKVAESLQEKARSAEIGFTSASGKSSSTVYATVSQTGLMGTLTNPFTVAQAIEYCNTLSGDSPSEFYVKGIVSAVLYTFSAQFGTGTFWISDDGVANGVSADKKSTTAPDKDFEAYGVYWLGNQPWADGNAQVEVGAEVILHGTLTLYKGTSETSNKKAYVYSVNGVTSDAEGIGTQGSPFTVAGAIPFATTGSSQNVYIKGKVSAVLYTFSAQFGTGTFWISDDGVANGVSADKKSTTAPDKDFEAYGVYYLNNTPWVEGNPQIAVGDEVILYGATTVYNGTSETANKKAWIYSHNGKTE